jgi:hypothetical protein
MIIPDGYNIGRDFLVEAAASVSHWNGMWWQADVEWRRGLLEPGYKGQHLPFLYVVMSLDLPFRN